jgi:hypothetical protein
MDQKEAVAEWLRRLRSGDIQQTQGVLARADGSRCCLGLACDIGVDQGIVTKTLIIVDEEFLKSHEKNTTIKVGDQLYVYDDGSVFDPSSVTILPTSVRRLFGLSTSAAAYFIGRGTEALTLDNDYKKLTFAQIADIIESKPTGLFLPE